jgi:FAD/FMN-containing dehydrogenase
VARNQQDVAETSASSGLASSGTDGTISSDAVRELAAAIRGEIVTPAHPGWDRARQPWDLVDQRPALVVLPLDAGDVRATVLFARRHGLHVTPQATGHNAAPLGPLEDTILLSTRHMRGVQVDAARRTARAEAGVVWSEVTQATTPYGLFPLAGSSPNVGVIGYTLGGGLSWLGRKHGLATNNVTAIEVVTADGWFRRVTPSEHTSLFWALRGGGGNFGVVTAVEFALFPYGEVYAGMFVWPYESHLEVVEAWHAWTRTAGDSITTSFRIVHFPAEPELPPFLSGRSVVMIDGAFAGDAAAGNAAVAGLRTLAPEVDTWSMMSPVALGRLHLDPEPPIPVLSTSALLDDLEPACLEALAAAAQPPLTAGEIRHIGGALARVPAGAGCLGSFQGQYLAFAGGIVTDRNRQDLVAALAHFDDAVAPYANGKLYYNFAESPADATRFYRDDAYARLRRLRAEVDPDGVIVANHPIPGAPGAR